ncbi:hypothetical protein [Patulibacter minatonensis]|uniref:hypothetical protein n=1 Tax=Patulibacter minatonensis TaxID=298163 RepID=UPI00047E992B|nr:hypothetical protein [Patulibacter minatonensis]
MLRRLLRPSLVLLAGLVLALTSAAPSSAATTFGADLTPPVTSTATCGQAFGTSSCLAYSVVPTSFAPFSGVVRTVRVKTGDTPQRPMQVLVLRQYYQNNLQNPGTPNIFCCFVQEYGPTFTPQRNAITEVPATLGMVEQPVPASGDGNTVAAGDFLALSVLDGTTAIPLTSSPSPVGAAFNAPAPTAPSTPAPSPNAIGGGQGGRQATVMLNADIEPLDAGGGGGATPVVPPAPGTPVQTTGPAPAATKPVLLKQHGGRLTRKAASLPVTCRLTATCAGMLTVRDRAPAVTTRAAAKSAKAKKAKKPVVLGTARFSVAAGRTKAVTVKLNAAGRMLARRHGKQTVYETATVGTVPVTTKVVLRR